MYSESIPVRSKLTKTSTAVEYSNQKEKNGLSVCWTCSADLVVRDELVSRNGGTLQNLSCCIETRHAHAQVGVVFKIETNHEHKTQVGVTLKIETYQCLLGFHNVIKQYMGSHRGYKWCVLLRC